MSLEATGPEPRAGGPAVGDPGPASTAGSDPLAAATEILVPRLRGALHLATLPVAVVAGVALLALAPDGRAEAACAVFALTSALMFGVSAAYHRGRWSARAARLLRRLDHSSIYLLVAGTYTPFAALALDGADRVVLLSVVWIGATAGVLFRMLAPDAPRKLHVPICALLGWSAVFFLPELLSGAGVLAMSLVVAGGLLYTAGAVVYAVQRPDTWPGVWGHHEWFHAATVAAWAVQYTAVAVLVAGG